MLNLIVDLKKVTCGANSAEFPVPIKEVLENKLKEVLGGLPAKTVPNEEQSSEMFLRLLKTFMPGLVTEDGGVGSKRYAVMQESVSEALETGVADEEAWGQLLGLSQVLFELERQTNATFNPEVVTTTDAAGNTTSGATWDSLLTEVAKHLTEDEEDAAATPPPAGEVKQELAAMSSPDGQISGNNLDAMRALAAAMITQTQATSGISAATAAMLETAGKLQAQALELLNTVNNANTANTVLWQKFGVLLDATPALPETATV